MDYRLEREKIIKEYVQHQGWPLEHLKFLAGDASHRKYYRLHIPGQQSRVIMDAPPLHENAGIFKHTSEILQSMGLSAPKILQEDLTQGILVLEDFGDQTYTYCLKNKVVPESELYKYAVDVLITLHQQSKKPLDVPFMTGEKFKTQVDLLLEWYFPYKNIFLPAEAKSAWDTIWNSYFSKLDGVPKALTLWDYHVDNLIWLPERQGPARAGLLDFQDAVMAPAAYDLVSLLEDARRDISPHIQTTMMQHYLDHLPHLDQAQFLWEYALMGVQRSTRILGTFVRLSQRDHKHHYLKFMPQVWKWVEQDLTHPQLQDLSYWYQTYIPHSLRERFNEK